MKYITDIIETMSDEEKELHKELIEECRTREAEVIEFAGVIRENLGKLSVIFEGIQKDLNSIQAGQENFSGPETPIAKEYHSAKVEHHNISLENIPDSEFFKA
ncbi:MAG: hypothetical protein GY754_05280 [bacterium]|nr:hypothetical protein [bacterium]